METFFLKSFRKDLKKINKEARMRLEEKIIPEIIKNPVTQHKLEYKGDVIFSYHFDIPGKKMLHYRIIFKVFENKVYFLIAGERKIYSEENDKFLNELEKRLVELKKTG